jgi:hypothetical protein
MKEAQALQAERAVKAERPRMEKLWNVWVPQKVQALERSVDPGES